MRLFIWRMKKPSQLRFKSNNKFKLRNAITPDSFEKWNKKDADGNTVVPYVIGDKEYDDEHLAIIMQVMQKFQITLVLYSKKREKKTFTTLKSKTWWNMLLHHRKTIVMHEMLHLLGLWHEQNRYDAAKYVKIHYDKIKPGNEQWLKRCLKMTQKNPIRTYGLPYDYLSVMHYHQYALLYEFDLVFKCDRYGKTSYYLTPPDEDLDTNWPIRSIALREIMEKAFGARTIRFLAHPEEEDLLYM
uniref:Peptidase M12A domain-containing protein n=1 Tax=Ditylenchus dipsaci TaxID=166011 RepID=A0A915CSA0_9BILA